MDDLIINLFGENVRRLRLAKGLSQEDLAELADCHRNYIGYVERGERNISLTKIVNIASALGCSCQELFQGLIPLESQLDSEK